MFDIHRPVLDWLLDSDPAVRWQVERDLVGTSPDAYNATRARIATEGWGARLLAERDDDATWGQTLYTPKWTSTFYTMRLLYWLGLDGTYPQAVETMSHLLDVGFRSDGGIVLWGTERSDCCVNAMTVSLAVRFGHALDERIDQTVNWLLAHRVGDGGWNCRLTERPAGAVKKSSFHTTLSTLEALSDYAEVSAKHRARVQDALDDGHGYVLRHRVHCRATSGRVVKEDFTRFSFPPRWYFDALRALDYLRRAEVAWDDRLERAIALVKDRRQKDGRWKNQNFHPGNEYFRLEEVGKASRWNTMRALRVLKWADAQRRS